MTPSLRGGSISLGYLLRTYTFNRTLYRMITCNLSLYHGALRNPSA
ncbi:hypothetical protein AYO29_04710 [Coxiella burnetii str. Schperling]|nr:hypothetical protein [Coxiella burnetii]ATN86837.1 hypothetical protein AYO29_04710 [Coxiella burnetii str. Schperling]